LYLRGTTRKARRIAKLRFKIPNSRFKITFHEDLDVENHASNGLAYSILRSSGLLES
jgi:hypothetical protein